jgi:hypothetical protein
MKTEIKFLLIFGPLFSGLAFIAIGGLFSSFMDVTIFYIFGGIFLLLGFFLGIIFSIKESLDENKKTNT